MTSTTITELFEEWSQQFEENCHQGDDCMYGNVKPYSSARMVHFYCDNGVSARYDLYPDEERNLELEEGDEEYYFIED